MPAIVELGIKQLELCVLSFISLSNIMHPCSREAKPNIMVICPMNYQAPGMCKPDHGNVQLSSVLDKIIF